MMIINHYFLCLGSDETETFFLPLALRLANTLRPLAEAMRSLKPCLFLLFLFEGWNVLFILSWYRLKAYNTAFFIVGKYTTSFILDKKKDKIVPIVFHTLARKLFHVSKGN